MRRALLVAAVGAGFLVALAPAASAHPLGNFTVNFADHLVVGAKSVQVLHSIDMAEIPTLQLQQSPTGPDANQDGHSTPAELATWSARTCAEVGPQLSLVLDGRRAQLTVTQASARFVPGQAGLPTSRLDCTFDSGRAASRSVSFSDPTSTGRTGWKEVTAIADCGHLSGTNGLPEVSPSRDLTAYPKDLLSSPLDVTGTSFSVSAGGCRTDAVGVAPATLPDKVLPRGVGALATSYTTFVGRQHLTLPIALLAVLFSIGLGSLHAVAPGHGKTVIAAYLVGQRGTKRQAFWLGATVTTTHTAGVLLLGALLSLTAVAAPERFVPATEVASGVLLAGVGVYLLRRALAARRAGDHEHAHDDHEHAHDDHGHPHDDHGHDHPHPHDEHDHDHGHPHEDHGHPHEDHGHPHEDHDHPHEAELAPAGATYSDGAVQTARRPHPAPPLVHSHGGRAHSHLPVADAPISWRTLATMGIAGGLVPSPSALVVLLGATALGRPVFGAVLVVGYGIGMALTLTLAGLLLLRAQAAMGRRGWLSGRGATALRVLPLGTAAVVLVVGGFVIIRGIITYHSLG